MNAYEEKKSMTTCRAGIAAAIAMSFLLTACGGAGGNDSIPPAGPATGTDANRAPSHGSKHKVKTKIRITIPRRKHHRRIRVHGHYISAATQSITIAITETGGTPVNYNANLTPASNSNCQQSLVSPLICNVVFSLAPGHYTATFATYDGLLQSPGDRNSPGTGNVLSQGQSAGFDIVAGQANGINVALDGVATGVAFVPAANSSLFGNTATGFSATKCGTASPNSELVSVFGTDADGNYIIGPGAPATTLESSDTTLMTVTPPLPTQPNLYTLSHPISNSSQNPATLQATVTNAADAGGGTQSVSTPVQVAGGTQLCGFITEFPLGDSNKEPGQIVVGPDNNLWFTLSTSGHVGMITTAGVVSEYDSGFEDGAAIAAITSGPQNSLWYGDSAQSIIGSVTTTGVVSNEFSVPTEPYVGPNTIAVGSDGNLWYTTFTGQLGNINPAGTVHHEYQIPNSNAPEALTEGPDGRVWFAMTGFVGAADTSGNISEYATGTPQGGSGGITVGPANELWFTEPAADKIGKVTTGGAVSEFTPAIEQFSGLTGVTEGPDGNIWFTELGAAKIGHIATDGTGLVEYPVPTGASNPTGIVTGPDGNIWFTECSVGMIGRLQ